MTRDQATARADAILEAFPGLLLWFEQQGSADDGVRSIVWDLEPLSAGAVDRALEELANYRRRPSFEKLVETLIDRAIYLERQARQARQTLKSRAAYNRAKKKRTNSSKPGKASRDLMRELAELRQEVDATDLTPRKRAELWKRQASQVWKGARA
tara:strand:+ start:2219 stop:2683 length:465 start_codon:yes stop_codon:yes gene_type:complete